MTDLIKSLKILDTPAIDGDKEEPKAPDWKQILGSASVTSADLQDMQIPKREPILGNWFRQGDLGYIYAPRGKGKTWLSMLFARAIAEGRGIGPWTVSQAQRVLYVDGEMALDLTKYRDSVLSQGTTESLFYLHHEIVFDRTGRVLNLSDPAVQAALLQHMLDNKQQVLFLDNISCLFPGVKENDADAWEAVLPWLLQLRRLRIAVVIIHHAGRNGLMRGTSRREDAAVWILSLVEPPTHQDETPGARFTARFVKCRNTTPEEAPDLEWTFRKVDENTVTVSHCQPDPLTIFRGWVETGLDSASEIAEEMGISKGQVSKLAKRGIDQGWLTKKGRLYKLVE